MKQQLWKLELGDSGVLAPGTGSRLRILAWTSFLFAATVGMLFLSVQGAEWLHLPKADDWVAAIGVPALSFFLYAFVVRKTERRAASEIQLTRSSLRELIIGAIIGCCFVCALLLLLWSLGLYQVQRSHWAYGWNSLVFNSYISGMLEELAFRAILLRLLARLCGIPAGLILSAALFGLAHITHGSWLGVFGIFINAGFLMGLLYMATGRLWMSVGAHIAWDFTEDSILGVGNQHGVLLSTPAATSPAFLTGGSFGPDASLLSGIIGIAVILAVIYAHSRGIFGKGLPATGNGY